MSSLAHFGELALQSGNGFRTDDLGHGYDLIVASLALHHLQLSERPEFYRIGGGGHSWPGSWFFTLIGFIVGPTATSINATDIIWDFFDKHHLSA